MHDAWWYPLYDLYALSQDGKPSTSVSLHYRVNLSQGTGEHWNDAKLVLSTSETDILNAGVPASNSLVIEPKQPPPPLPPPPVAVASKKYRRSRGSTRFMDVDAEAPSPSDDEYEEADVDPTDLLAGVLPGTGAGYEVHSGKKRKRKKAEMSEGGAAISKTPMAVSYTVDELTTIPSDGESHNVLVAIVPFEATISHITTPRKSPLAYLQVCPPPTSESVYHPTYHPAYSAW